MISSFSGLYYLVLLALKDFGIFNKHCLGALGNVRAWIHNTTGISPYTRSVKDMAHKAVSCPQSYIIWPLMVPGGLGPKDSKWDVPDGPAHHRQWPLHCSRVVQYGHRAATICSIGQSARRTTARSIARAASTRPCSIHSSHSRAPTLFGMQFLSVGPVQPTDQPRATQPVHGAG